MKKEIIEMLEDSKDLPENHKLIMLLIATGVGFTAKLVTEKYYIAAFTALRNLKSH